MQFPLYSEQASVSKVSTVLKMLLKTAAYICTHAIPVVHQLLGAPLYNGGGV